MMGKKSYVLALCLCMFILSSSCSNEKYNSIFYVDITYIAQYGTDEYEDGDVIIDYVHGHQNDEMTIIFKSYQPYSNIDMYGSDDVLYIKYIEDSGSSKRDIIFHIDGFYGQNGFYRKEIGDNLYTLDNSAINITINGKRLNKDNIHVSYGIE